MLTDIQCRVMMLISDVSLNDASVCMELMSGPTFVGLRNRTVLNPYVLTLSSLPTGIYIYTQICIQCALPVITIMALWQLLNLGTGCTVTHCWIALWSHKSAQTASSERSNMPIVNTSYKALHPIHRVLKL